MLLQVPIFANLEAGLLEELSRSCRRRRFAAQEALFHQDDPGQTLYIIVRGRVKIQVTSASGETIHLAERGTGDHFGEMSLIDGKPRMADAITAEACELLMLDRDAFVRCIQKSPRIALSAMTTLADRLREAALQLQKQQQLDVLGRVSKALLQLTQADSLSSGAVPLPPNAPVVVAVTRQELADRVGARRESVSRALAHLQEAGSIQLQGRSIVVVSKPRLRKNCAID